MNTRNYRVKGQIACLYSPAGIPPVTTHFPNILIQFWHKEPLQPIFLGSGSTDAAGNFIADFEIDSPIYYIVGGKINDVFAKVYFNGQLINEGTPATGLVLNEGYTDLGILEANVTGLENNKTPINPEPISTKLPVSNSSLFKLYYDLGQLVSQDINAIFSIKGAEGNLIQESTLNPDPEGYIQLDIPILPTVVINTGTADTVIKYFVDGPLDRRNEENYLEVSGSRTGSNIYTLIWDIVVHENLLQIKDNSGGYHQIEPTLTVVESIGAIYINKKGQVYGYNTLTSLWTSIGTLNFTRFEFPEKLTVASDGFYVPSTSSGTVTVGTLGTVNSPFEDFFGIVKNQEPYYLTVGLNVFNPDSGGLPPVFTGEFTLMPGDINYHPVLLGGAPPVSVDHSPGIAEIQAISGITFSAAFESFLTVKGLTTADTIRKAGPITYVNNFPAANVGELELKTLQGHVDLYSINSNPVQNQYLISLGYSNIQKIGNTPKNLFLDAVVDASLPLFEAAKIHEVVSQNQKLVTNLLGATLTDLKLVSPLIPSVPGSNFVTTSLANAVSTCGCDDCKSGISPFAYLLDLIKYASAHIQHTTVPIYQPGSSINDFVTLISDKFLQPFGTLNIDCDTLHAEYCRVRLVTEVFEKLVDIKIANGSISPAHISKLAYERNQFLLLTYKSILTETGTSIEELRDVITTKPVSEKIKVAQSFADKLGIPLYDPIYPNFTADRMWLTIGNLNPLQELNAVNLEMIFGFRDTKRNVLTNTPLSVMEQWQSIYLRSVWKIEDYSFTDYSRENVVAATDATFKSNWKPIIDPDIMGWTDLTYLTSSYAKELWQNRKQTTDDFLTYCLANTANTARTSLDFNNRILKVVNRNIVTHVLEGDIIQIEKPAGTWNDFNVLNLSLNEINTDVILKKSTPSVLQPPMIQPVGGASPKMRYKRVLNVISGSIVGSGTSIVINWPNPVFQDQLIGGYAKLESTAGTSPYQTNPPGVTPLLINTVTFNTSQQVTLTFPSPGPDLTFINGDVKFVYEVEVPIFTDIIMSPEDITNTLFTTNQNYTLLTPVPVGMTSPLVYTVWDLPTWPVIITATTNYGRLKQMYQFIAASTSVSDFTAIIENNLHMTLASFNQMMLLMIKCENYLNSMYTFVRPSTDELYQQVSTFWNSAKTPQRDTWVKEEIKGSTTPPAMLMLDGQFFWKAISEPLDGPWDPSLQTIPTTVSAINSSHNAIIDPELVPVVNLVINPEAKPYRDLYEARKLVLQTEFTTYKAYTQTVVFDPDAFTKMLNKINTGNPATPFIILPYTSLAFLISDLESTDLFKQKEASDVLWNSFRLTRDQFLVIVPIKNAYELNDAAKLPTIAQVDKVINLLVSAFKRNRLYPTIVAGPAGWIEQEITGIFPGGIPVFYYNVLKMRMAPGRSDFANRKLWQSTLEAWNRQPFIQSDIIPPENIKDFIPANWIYTTWNLRRIALINAYNNIATYINPAIPTAGALFTNLKGQIDLIVSRTSAFIPPITFDYLPYFTDIIIKEKNKEDIRPYLTQLGISLTEYRFLSKIYKVLENATPSGPSPLIESEYPDVIDILIHIRNINLPFDQVQEEYTQGILLDQDYFQIYKPVVISFPLVDITPFNKWRSPYRVRKAWLDTLQTRIDREKAVKNKWKEILGEAEDINMPYMRDSLIRALTNNCELFQDACERLAKTYFVETKDNCCVKHSRVSFAIETLQGLFFALQNGVFDGFISDFKLIAPYFSREWQWLGSYATWRSAMFVYLYPENLLYPTLKRKQSHAFISLSDRLRNANRLSPEDACFEAKQFQDYLLDIESLEIVCSTSARSYYEDTNANQCCDTPSILKWETYFFAQSKTGKPYWCIKQTEEWDGLGFWQPLPIEIKDVKLLGCFLLGSRGDGWAPIEESLYLFYSYLDKGKLKMGNIQKPLFDIGSSWTAPTDMEDLPKLEDVEPAFITACQLSLDWEFPCFIFSYGKVVDHNQTITLKHPWSRHQFNKPHSWYMPPTAINIPLPITNNVHIPFGYNRKSDKFSSNHTRVYNNDLKPVTAIFHPLPIVGGQAGLSIVFPLSVNMGFWGKEETAKWTPLTGGGDIKSIVGAFESRAENDTIILHYRNQADLYKVKKLTVTSALTAYDPLTQPTPFPITATDVVGSLPTDFVKIYPFFQERDAPRTYAVRDTRQRLYSAKLPEALPTTNYCALIPEKVSEISIESADCIKDMNSRKANIEAKLKRNMNPPQGSGGWLKRPDSVRELLYESYYFVPMLIALDQQKRGQYISALSWYRSVYDYTNSIVNQRKIFYGLKLEETILNVFSQADGWLLDPLNPHLIAQTRAGAYTKYTLINIIQCINGYADREFTLDTIETVPIARKLYSEALDLLKVKELNYSANKCLVASNACLDSATSAQTSIARLNLYGKLKEDLSAIGNATIIESLTAPIADLINSATEETYPAKFASAFALIESSTPPPVAAESMIGVIDGQDKRLNDASRYVFALNDPSNFNKAVADKYTIAVAGISGLSVAEVSTSDATAKIGWLLQPTPDNSTPFQFEFANAGGQQFFSGDLAYNPLLPSPGPRSANLAYFNATSVIGLQLINMPVTFAPLLDFKFCMPQNPVYKSLQLKGNVELYKIFNCRNIAGIVRELDIFAAATDSSTGMPMIGASGNLVLPGLNNFSPTQYRFRVLIERAKQIAQQAQQMESLFLASIEKEDAENYSQLRGKQDLETSKATIKLQDLRVNQSKDERTSASLQLDKVNFSQAHYNELLANGLLDFEQNSLNLLRVAAGFQIAAAALNLAAAGLFTGTFDFGDSSGQLSIASSNIASSLSTFSSIQSQLASFKRREQEWQFQSQLAGFDISIANQQVKIADDNIRIVTQEREIAVLNSDHAQQSLDFIKTKFTNAELYNWMGNVLESSYNYMLSLSTAIARTAEGQLYFERQEQAGPFILDDYWETPSSGFNSGTSNGNTDRRGLTGSARLLVDITKLEQHSIDTNKRKLQMTKVISLAQNFPSEFQNFKSTGVLNFELTNKLFDYDFPGHYLRLVNSVKTTVVGLLPVYDSIKASLTADSISYTVIGGNTFQKIPIRRLELDSVALTSANNASGLFELQPTQNELLNPFEAMGIESRWEFKMPQFSNRINYSNIADVLLTVEYTAFDSYIYRTQVLQDIDNVLSFNRGFSFKNNFPDQWYELGEAQSGSSTFAVTVQLERELFPQGINDLKLDGSNLSLYFVRANTFEDEIESFDFSLAGAIPSLNKKTVNGLLSVAITPIGNSPIMDLTLVFDNNFTNRELFTQENVTDILLLVGCKAELTKYPL